MLEKGNLENWIFSPDSKFEKISFHAFPYWDKEQLLKDETFTDKEKDILTTIISDDFHFEVKTSARDCDKDRQIKEVFGIVEIHGFNLLSDKKIRRLFSTDKCIALSNTILITILLNIAKIVDKPSPALSAAGYLEKKYPYLNYLLHNASSELALLDLKRSTVIKGIHLFLKNYSKEDIIKKLKLSASDYVVLDDTFFNELSLIRLHFSKECNVEYESFKFGPNSGLNLLYHVHFLRFKIIILMIEWIRLESDRIWLVPLYNRVYFHNRDIYPSEIPSLIQYIFDRTGMFILPETFKLHTEGKATV